MEAEDDERSQLSVHVSKELEKCGFSRHKLEAKSAEVKILEHLENDGRNLQLFATGSNAEGVDISGSDRDTMLVVSGVCAVWSKEEIKSIKNPSNYTVFLIEQTGLRPGYAKLRLIQESSQENGLFKVLGGKQKLCRMQHDAWYISSEQFVQQAKCYTSNLFQTSSTHSMHAFHVHGPCATFDNIVGKTTFETDFAFAIPCFSVPEQDTFLMRRYRTCDWPPAEVVEFGRTYGCHLVAVGSKVSESDDMEWRVSFALLERELVWSLGDMHCKCYVLLKMLVKQFIEPLAPEQMSSYTVKTALLWLTEAGQIDDQENQLIANVSKCLKNLCDCVKERKLPHYIIPENNLLLTKFEDKDIRLKVVEKLSEIATWHWSHLLRCSALSLLNDLWKEFQPDVQSFFRHARHPNLKPLVYKDVIHYRSVQSIYLSLCSVSATQSRHLKILMSLTTLHPSHDDQTVNFLSKVICNRLLFAIANVDDIESLYRPSEKTDEQEAEPGSPQPHIVTDINKTRPEPTAEEVAIMKLTQASLRLCSDNGSAVSAAQQLLLSKFDVCTTHLQLAVKYYLRGDYDSVYESLQTVMAAYKPQVLYLGLCGPEEVGEFDIIEYLCYVTSSENMPFAEKICKCLSFDYVICRCDPIIPIFKLALVLWPEEEVPLCVHPRVLIHYLMFLVHFRQHRPASALASLAYLVLNVQGTAPYSQLYGHLAWNLVGHGYFLMGKMAWAMRAFRASLKAKATFNPAAYYLRNC